MSMAAKIAATSTAGNHVHFIHQALCSPPTPTLLRALAWSSKLTTIPGLTPHLILQHLPPSTATDKGHMQRHCQGVQTMQTQQPGILQACSNVNCFQPTKEMCFAHGMFCFAALADLHIRTIHQWYRCRHHVIFLQNAICVCGIRVRPECHPCPRHAIQNDGALIAAFADTLVDLNTHGYAPTLNIMDNKCTTTVEAHI